MATLDDFKEYISRSKGKVLALRSWLILKGRDKTITLSDALQCIKDAAKGNMTEMDNIIAHLTNKKKTYGRGQVYNDSPTANSMDLKRDENGTLRVVNYHPQAPLTAKGMKVQRNSNIFKADGQINRNYQRVADRMSNIGAEVRQRYPDASKDEIESMIDSIRKYTAMKKISVDKAMQQLDSGRITFNQTNFSLQMRECRTNNKTIIITEAMADELGEDFQMTEYKFNNNLKIFLRNLLIDPINTRLPDGFSKRGYTKSRFISILENNGILVKQERISDTDEFGEPKTATMMVKYKVPRADLERKIRKLYIKMFEKNVPEVEKIEEEGEGGGATCADASGQFSAPCFPVQRRKMPIATDESTTTTTVGDYEYTAPAFGDDETLARHNGVGGSVSINRK